MTAREQLRRIYAAVEPLYERRDRAFADMVYSGRRSNYSRIEDSELDALWDKANMTADEEERRGLYEEIQTRINDNTYIYPIAYSKGFYAVDNQFKGFDECLLKTIYYDYSKIYSVQ